MTGSFGSFPAFRQWLLSAQARVKTQKRPHVVSFKLDWISGEVGFRWK